jgi:hypothetical protein
MLHIEDSNGHQVTVPLRGRASVLTPGGTGLTGYGEVWAVHISATAPETALMISYGPDGAPESGQSGLCTAGATIELSGVRFTWRQTQPPAVPRPRASIPRNLRVPPAKTAANTRAAPEPAGTGLGRRLRNMVRVVTQSTGPRSR